MPGLRVVGDVHGQVDEDSLITPGRRPFFETIASSESSVQVGDMGDAETYAALAERLDPARHRFVAGNHDHYHALPPHCLGDFGEAELGGVPFFFVRGAASTDREKLVALGARLGRTLWFAQEELTDAEMAAAEAAYARARPAIVITHDGPIDPARAAYAEAARRRWRATLAPFEPSRTNQFLTRLLELHRPRLWLFGHHHQDWQGWDGTTRFVCVGELSAVDITPAGDVVTPS